MSDHLSQLSYYSLLDSFQFVPGQLTERLEHQSNRSGIMADQAEHGNHALRLAYTILLCFSIPTAPNENCNFWQQHLTDFFYNLKFSLFLNSVLKLWCWTTEDPFITGQSLLVSLRSHVIDFRGDVRVILDSDTVCEMLGSFGDFWPHTNVLVIFYLFLTPVLENCILTGIIWIFGLKSVPEKRSFRTEGILNIITFNAVLNLPYLFSLLVFERD